MQVGRTARGKVFPSSETVRMPGSPTPLTVDLDCSHSPDNTEVQSSLSTDAANKVDNFENLSDAMELDGKLLNYY